MPKPTILPSSEYLNECLEYCPETGILTWKDRPLSHFAHQAAQVSFRTRYAGKPAGTHGSQGYVVVYLSGASYQAHRLIWCMYYGGWPENDIDHINLNKADNRISNLRDVPRSVNSLGRALYRSNSSGHVGVHFSQNRWMARIQVANQPIYLGLYREFDDAVAAYEKAKAHYQFSDRHGASAPTVVVEAQEGHVCAHNSSGVTGVFWDPEVNKWEARLVVNRVVKNLGTYSDKADAAAARLQAELTYKVRKLRGRGPRALILPQSTTNKE